MAAGFAAGLADNALHGLLLGFREAAGIDIREIMQGKLRRYDQRKHPIPLVAAPSG